MKLDVVDSGDQVDIYIEKHRWNFICRKLDEWCDHHRLDLQPFPRGRCGWEDVSTGVALFHLLDTPTDYAAVFCFKREARELAMLFRLTFA
jgi:hypothetical protein